MTEGLHTYYIGWSQELHDNHTGGVTHKEGTDTVRAFSAADALIQWRTVHGPEPFKLRDTCQFGGLCIHYFSPVPSRGSSQGGKA